ncbi:MAG TPA: hypothetical protein VKA68_03475 [bacterium]|nr:hypothetical protein [bacterium]
MAMTRWNPTRELMSAWNDFDRLFSRLLDSERSEGDGSDLSNVGVWRPAIDITEHEKAYELTVELPGMQEDDIHLFFKIMCLLSLVRRRVQRRAKIQYAGNAVTESSSG